MGSGSFTEHAYASYSVANDRTYDAATGRVSGQSFRQRNFDKSLNPRYFDLRECVNSEEHPNTIPVILALDVTGSMGDACRETVNTLGVIMTNLYKKFDDIEFCIMGIGDLAYDAAPIQMSQFESDVRIAESLDKVWLEKGGGGNDYESYTAAWYMGLFKTKLDCFDKQNRKGIIITMGDEPMNPYLPIEELNNALGGKVSAQGPLESKDLYEAASKKFDIFHIAVNDNKNCYRIYYKSIEQSFGQLLGNHLKVSTIQELAKTIEDCITESVQGVTAEPVQSGIAVTENGEITW